MALMPLCNSRDKMPSARHLAPLPYFSFFSFSSFTAVFCQPILDQCNLLSVYISPTSNTVHFSASLIIPFPHDVLLTGPPPIFLVPPTFISISTCAFFNDFQVFCVETCTKCAYACSDSKSPIDTISWAYPSDISERRKDTFFKIVQRVIKYSLGEYSVTHVFIGMTKRTGTQLAA